MDHEAEDLFGPAENEEEEEEEESERQSGMSINSVTQAWSSQRVTKGRWDADEKRTEELMRGYERKSLRGIMQKRESQAKASEIPGVIFDMREESENEEQWDMDSLEQCHRAERIVRQGEAVMLVTKPAHMMKNEFEHLL